MISKRWLPPTRNLFGQMMRSLARTHAAAIAAEDAENEENAGELPTDHPDLDALIAVAEMAGLKDSQLRRAWATGLEEGRGMSSMASSGLSFAPELVFEGVSSKPGVCAHPDCDEPAKVRAYCVRHYRRMRYAEARRTQGLDYRPRSGGSGRRQSASSDGRPSIPRYAIEVLREIGAPLTIDRVCELVRDRAADIDLPEARVLRARVRHFLYTSPKTERAGRGTFQIKGGANRVLRRPAAVMNREGEESGNGRG